VSDQLSLLLLISSFELYQLARDFVFIFDLKSSDSRPLRSPLNFCHALVTLAAINGNVI
jgi:hypothetical protein